MFMSSLQMLRNGINSGEKIELLILKEETNESIDQIQLTLVMKENLLFHDAANL